ncbi:transposase [Streptococcus pneumoniae]|nr:transposase [Streptococcus pneumoniae]
MPDHVHMLVSIPLRLSVSSFMGYLKGKSALMMFDKHATSTSLGIGISGRKVIL